VKLLEALLESTPQLYVQAVLLIKSTPATDSSSFVLLVVSLAFSVLSIAFAQSKKLDSMVGHTASRRQYCGLMLYFIADAILRATAFAAVFEVQGIYILCWIGTWYLIELITLLLM